MLAIIGGSGFYALPEFSETKQLQLTTSYGEPSGKLVYLQANKADDNADAKGICFLARHGVEHHIPPHKINYRANIQALADSGVNNIIAFNAVGSCNPDMPVGAFVLPNQIIDYSYGREHTFFDSLSGFSSHIDFTEPFSSALRQKLANALTKNVIEYYDGATYGCTQGPRFETTAEIKRLRADGCDLVGMTMMPEACLARERGLNYASICVVVNMAAGMSDVTIELDKINAVLASAVKRFAGAVGHIIQ